jgi:hypothetical protein
MNIRTLWITFSSGDGTFLPDDPRPLINSRLHTRGTSLVAQPYTPFAAACSSRAYCVGGRPTCRVKATLKVLAEL